MLGCDAMKCLTCCANVGVHMHRRPLVIYRQPLVHPAIRRFIFVCVCVCTLPPQNGTHILCPLGAQLNRLTTPRSMGICRPRARFPTSFSSYRTLGPHGQTEQCATYTALKAYLHLAQAQCRQSPVCVNAQRALSCSGFARRRSLCV